MTNTAPKGLVSTASATINAPVAKVWDAFVNPDTIKQDMFGAQATSDWKEGSPITWKGEYEGKSYEDKGVIQKLQPEKLLQYTHYSPLAGKPDTPENYHTVTVALQPQGDKTDVSLSQDNNPDEEARQHTGKFWQDMLDRVKEIVEK
jgi:uncharacterized protein YndB with AHSA1/START domain